MGEGGEVGVDGRTAVRPAALRPDMVSNVNIECRHSTYRGTVGGNGGRPGQKRGVGVRGPGFGG